MTRADHITTTYEVVEGEDGTRRVRVIVADDRVGDVRSGLAAPRVQWGDGQEIAFGPPERALARYESAYTGEDLVRSGEERPRVTVDGIEYELTGPTTVFPLVPEGTSIAGAMVDPKLPYLRFEMKDVMISSYSAKPDEVGAFTEAVAEMTVAGLEGVGNLSYAGTSYVFEADAPAELSGELSVRLGEAQEPGLVVDSESVDGARLEEVSVEGDDVVVWWSQSYPPLSPSGDGIAVSARTEAASLEDERASSGTLEERVFAVAYDGGGELQNKAVRIGSYAAHIAFTGDSCAANDRNGGVLCGTTDHFRAVNIGGVDGMVTVGQLTEIEGSTGFYVSIAGPLASLADGVVVELLEEEGVRVVELPLVREFHAATLELDEALSPGDAVSVEIEDTGTGASNATGGVFVDADRPINAWFDVEGESLVTWVVVSEHRSAADFTAPRVEIEVEGANVPALVERAGQALLAAPGFAASDQDADGVAEYLVTSHGSDGAEDLVVEAPADTLTEASGLGVNIQVDTRGPNIEVRLEGSPEGLEQLGFKPGASPASVDGVALEAIDYRSGWYAEVEGVELGALLDQTVKMRATLGEADGQSVEVEAAVVDRNGPSVTLMPATLWLDREVAILTRYHERLEDRMRSLTLYDGQGGVVASLGDGPPTTEERVFSLEFDAPVADGDALEVSLEGLGDSPDDSLYESRVDVTVGGGWVFVDMGIDDAVTRWARVDLIDGRARLFYSETTAGGGLGVGSVGVGVSGKNGDMTGDNYITYEYGLLYEIVENDLLEDENVEDVVSAQFGETLVGETATFSATLELGNDPGFGGRVWPLIAGFGKGTKKSTSSVSYRPELL